MGGTCSYVPAVFLVRCIELLDIVAMGCLYHVYTTPAAAQHLATTTSSFLSTPMRIPPPPQCPGAPHTEAQPSIPSWCPRIAANSANNPRRGCASAQAAAAAALCAWMSRSRGGAFGPAQPPQPRRSAPAACAAAWTRGAAPGATRQPPARPVRPGHVSWDSASASRADAAPARAAVGRASTVGVSPAGWRWLAAGAPHTCVETGAGTLTLRMTSQAAAPRRTRSAADASLAEDAEAAAAPTAAVWKLVGQSKGAKWH